MATNLSIRPELIERALAVSGERTKKAAVTLALEESIARRRQRGLLELMGKNLSGILTLTVNRSASAAKRSGTHEFAG